MPMVPKPTEGLGACAAVEVGGGGCGDGEDGGDCGTLEVSELVDWPYMQLKLKTVLHNRMQKRRIVVSSLVLGRFCPL